MGRFLLAVSACAFLAACGGGNSNSRAERVSGGAGVTQAFASGPMSKACMRAGRKAANARLCGCVQAVANGGLSSRDQALAAGFFADPHQAQVIRQSDDPGHEAFWKRYRAFASRAERSCRGL